jgi:hypothetical protein
MANASAASQHPGPNKGVGVIRLDQCLFGYEDRHRLIA